MRLVCGGHPGAQTFVEQDVLGVEGFEFGIFSGPDFLAHEVIGAQVECKADDADAAGPQPHHGHEQHEEVQPTLVGEGDPKDLAPETVGGDHRIGLFFLGGLERLEGVGLLGVFKQGVLHRGAVDGAEQGTAEDAGHAHHVEGVQRPVVEALQEEQEAEDGGHAEAGCEEPAALAEGVHQEDADENRDRAGEGDGVVGTDAHQTGNFELTQHEADQGEGAVQGHEGPEAAELDPANEIALGLRAPEEQEAVAHGVSGGADGGGEEVAALQVGAGNAVGVPGGGEGGAGQPTPQGQIGRGEKQQTGPPHENEAVALQPVIEDVEPSPGRWRPPYSNRHGKNGAGNPLGCGIPGDRNNPAWNDAAARHRLKLVGAAVAQADSARAFRWPGATGSPPRQDGYTFALFLLYGLQQRPPCDGYRFG